MINPLQLTGKKYLVTGAASGIGRATALLLAELGAELLLVDINGEGLEALKAGIGSSKHQTLVADLSDLEGIAAAVLPAVKCFGKLNGFAHIAGVPYIAPIKSLNLEKLQKVFAVNAFAAAELARIFCNKLYHAAEGSCSVVFISSVYGAEIGSPCNSGYAMSKAAIEGLTRSLAMEMAPRSIRVNCVAPGFVKTAMDESISGYFDAEHSQAVEKLHPLGGGALGEPEDIANAVAFLLSDAARWITGTVLRVDGGFAAQ